MKIKIIAAVVALIGTAIIGFSSYQIKNISTDPVSLIDFETIKTGKNPLEVSCVNSGGTITEASCCISANDFPNSCVIGSCGCSQENSKVVKTCYCGDQACFDGEKCASLAPEETCSGKGGISMTISEALAIAQSGVCKSTGILETSGQCNSNTGTWWIPLSPYQPTTGCNPACVVGIDNGTSDINWRCTGLLPE